MRVDGLAFSPDGRLLASGSADNTIRLWDTITKREARTLTGNSAWVKAVAFSPNGASLASAAIDGSIRFFDVASGREQLVFKNNGSLTSIAFNADGSLFAAGNMEKEVRVWSLVTKGPPLVLSGHTAPVTTIAFSHDGNFLASGSADRTIKVWSVPKGREVTTLTGYADKITAISFSADGQLMATAGWDTRIRLWRVNGWREQPGSLTAPDKVLGLRFTPDGRTLISVDRNKRVKSFDLSTGRSTTATEAARSDEALEAIATAFSNDGRWLALSTGDKTIQLRDVATGSDVQTLTTHSFGVYATAFSSGGHWFAAGGQENTIKLWEVASGRELRTLDPAGGFVNTIGFSPDEQLLVSGGLSGDIALWGVSTAELVRNFRGHQGSVNAVAFSPDGKRIVSGGNDHTVRLWDVITGNQIGAAAKHAAEVSAVAFSPDGKQVVSASADKTIKIWDANTGSEVRALTGHKGEVLAVAYSPDGRSLASADSEGNVIVWDAATGIIARTLLDHKAEVKTVAFSRDGKILASGSKDSSIDLWDVGSGRLVNKLLGHFSEVYSLTFSADGNWLASGSEDGSTRLWNATTGAPAASIISLRESVAGYALPHTDWLVVSPNGLFDGSPAAWNQILWRFNQSTLDVRPVEVFFSEYFYPGLLAEILAGKNPRAPQDISQIDRRQPDVSLATDNQSPASTVGERNLRVRITVAEAPSDSTHPNGGGVRDVRLFRNGSLVKIWRGDVLSNGSRQVLETTIPIIAGANQLTAYAFNHDNIKSSDASVVVTGSESLRRPATAYILAVGLNKYENAGYNLKFAVADASDFSEVVSREQNILGRFSRVEMISLNDEQATKSNIMYALHRLAGIEDPSPTGIAPELAKLKAAEPEDAVVVYFAGHGLAYESRFYMLPHDLGYLGLRRRLTQAGFDSIASHSISDRELEQAFEKVNASQILFVIDACNSGQALEADEARRGPMNSKGLAQLAYEKGIYVLAAAQSYQAAQEADELGHGLLTYALIEEGLKKATADRAPRDGRVLLQEWLDYAIERVPQFQEEKMRQARDAGKNLAFVEGEDTRDLLKRNLQRPRAFYRRDLPVPLIAINERMSPGRSER